jgi:hypothetical protein
LLKVAKACLDEQIMKWHGRNQELVLGMGRLAMVVSMRAKGRQKREALALGRVAGRARLRVGDWAARGRGSEWLKVRKEDKESVRPGVGAGCR